MEEKPFLKKMTYSMADKNIFSTYNKCNGGNLMSRCDLVPESLPGLANSDEILRVLEQDWTVLPTGQS